MTFDNLQEMAEWLNCMTTPGVLDNNAIIANHPLFTDGIKYYAGTTPPSGWERCGNLLDGV